MAIVATKAELVEAIRTAGVELVARVRALPPDAFSGGRWENGWNGHQILAHVASSEWTYPRLIDLARLGSPDEAAAAVDGFDVNAYNQRQVAKRGDASIEELLAEFERNREATIAAVEACPDELLEAHVKAVGGIEGTLAEVLRYVAVTHGNHHVGDIAG